MKSSYNRCIDYILILKSLAVNLPILQSWGYIFPRLLRVVVEPGTQVQVKDVLANFIDLKNRKNWNSDFHFYISASSGKDIASKVKDTLFEGNSNNGIPIVITDNPIVDDEERNYFFIFLEERQYSISYNIGGMVPYPSELDAIHTKLMKQETYEISEEERILRAAVYFLEPYFFRKGELFRVEELLDLVNQMCVIDENARDTNDMPEVFVKYLFEWQRETNFSKIRDLSAEEKADTDSDESIFYDDENVYLSEKIFKEVVDPMRAYVPLNSLKKSLRDNGYLITGKGNSANTYTVKVNVSGESCSENRIRVMKFKRDLLTVPGGMNFIDICYLASIGGVEDV